MAGPESDRGRLGLRRQRRGGAAGPDARPLDRPCAPARGRRGRSPARGWIAVRAVTAVDDTTAVPARDGDARRLLLEPRHAVRVLLRLVHAGAVARDTSLPREPRLAAPRPAADVGA